jgi:hypothetical protein
MDSMFSLLKIRPKKRVVFFEAAPGEFFQGPVDLPLTKRLAKGPELTALGLFLGEFFEFF